MAKQLLVFLVSEQTIPNVQFLKWYLASEKADSETDLLLVSTDKMENSKVSDKILDAAEKFERSYKDPYVVTVKEYDIKDIRLQLDGFISSNHYDSIAANITGGTKIMSLAVYQCISRINGTIYYKPMEGTALLELYPEIKSIDYDVNLTFDEYLSALGFEYETNPKQCCGNYDFNRTLYKNCLKKHGDGMRALTALNIKNEDGTFNLMKMKESKGSSFSDSDVCHAEEIVTYCRKDPSRLSVDFMKYIMGGWFEELVYQHIKNKFDIPDTHITYNMKVNNKYSDLPNEFDVVYLYEDVLNVIECKAYLQPGGNNSKTETAFNKLNAIKSSLGSNAKLHFYTTSKITGAPRKKADTLKIEIVCGKMSENL